MKRFGRVGLAAVVLAVFMLGGFCLTGGARAESAGVWGYVDSSSHDSLEYVRFFDATTGVVHTSADQLLTTSATGTEWSVREIPYLGDGISGVFFLDAQHGWACDANYAPEEPDYILRTVDGGKTWARVEQALPRLGASLFFTDTKVGYVVGASSQHWGGGISKTTDGGLTWRDAGGESPFLMC